MSKRLPWLISSTLLVPTLASAVGLGPIKLQSYLNQPFKANIKLLSVKNIPLDDIKVKLASDKDFSRVGIDKNYALTQLKFQVVQKDGVKHILISSHERMAEPYLRFLIDVATPNGQFFRAYTVLLDPPSYTVSAEPVRSKPKRHRSVAKRKPASQYVPSKVRSSMKMPFSPTPVNKADMTTVVHTQPPSPIETVHPVQTKPQTVKPSIQAKYTVKSNDSLYRIAKRYKTDSSMTVDQIMLAIVGENPEAFIGNNVNRMKAGRTLRIPSENVIRSITARYAEQEVAAQNKAWRSGTAVKHVLAPPFFSLRPLPTQSHAVKVGAKGLMQRMVASNNAMQVKPTTQNSKASGSVKRVYPQTSQKMAANHFPSDIPLPAVLQMRVNNPRGVEASPLLQNSNKQTDLEKNLRAELAVSAQAVTTVRQSNIVLQQQLHSIQQQNKQLQQQVDSKDQQIKQMQSRFVQLQQQFNQLAGKKVQSAQPQAGIGDQQINTPQASADTIVNKVAAVAGQAVADMEQPAGSWLNKFFMMLIILASGSIAGAGWLYYRQRRAAVDGMFDDSALDDRDFDDEVTATDDEVDTVEQEELVQAFNEQPQVEIEDVDDDEATTIVEVEEPNEVSDESAADNEAVVEEEYDERAAEEALNAQLEQMDFTVPSEAETQLADLDELSDAEAITEEGEAAEADNSLEMEDVSDLLNAKPVEAEPEAVVDDDDNSLDFSVEPIAEEDGEQTDDQSAEEIDDLGEDVVATKLDLSVAYINMEDYDAAKKLLEEVIQDGDEQQQQEAQKLLAKIPE